MSEIAQAAAEAIGMIDTKSTRGGSPLTVPVRRAMARVTYLSVKGGGLKRRGWIPCPMFLPSNDSGWASLLNSRQASENETKAAATRWFQDNFVVLSGNAQNLDCVATSFQFLEEARAANPDDAEILEWQTTLWEMAHAEYGVDIGQAPAGDVPTMKLWAMTQCLGGHPVPEWIRQDKAEPEVTFGAKPKPRPAANPYDDTGKGPGDFSLSGTFGAALRGDQ